MINLCLDMTTHETIIMWDDILKFLTIAIVIHLLTYAVDNEGELFDEKSLKLFLYLIISLVIYNLFIRRILLNKITQDGKQNKKNKQKFDNKLI
jgi:uncharacterized membrane protein